MLEGKSTASGDALGCGVCYGAAPSAHFLPQADIWLLRALSWGKPTVPPLRVWPCQAIEWQGSGSKAPPQLGHRPWVAASCSPCTVCPLDFPLGRFRLFSSVELVRTQGGLYAPPHPTEMPPFDFFRAPGRYVALGWAYMGSWGAMSDPPYQLHVRPSWLSASPPQKNVISPFISPASPSQLVYGSVGLTLVGPLG